MKITIEDLLRDRKENTFDAQDKIRSILKFYVGDLENKVFNEKEYRQLGWYENEYFDVINSFYTTYKRALMICDFEIREKKEYAGNALTIGESLYCELKQFKKANIGKPLEEFAELTHCVANFMPYPKLKIRLRGKEKELWIFNSAKGTSKAHDYLPLFVDLIQQCIDDNDNLIYDGNHKWIEFKYLDQWSDWLIANVDEYCLSCYYEVKDGKLKGKPFFKGQSLAHPYPQNAEEVNECVSNMINCIKIRAEELLYRINEQGASK